MPRRGLLRIGGPQPRRNHNGVNAVAAIRILNPRHDGNALSVDYQQRSDPRSRSAMRVSRALRPFPESFRRHGHRRVRDRRSELRLQNRVEDRKTKCPSRRIFNDCSREETRELMSDDCVIDIFRLRVFLELRPKRRTAPRHVFLKARSSTSPRREPGA